MSTIKSIKLLFVIKWWQKNQFSRETPLPIEESLARDESSQQLRCKYKRGRRKEDSLFYEVNDFLRSKKNDRKCVKRGKRDSRFSTSSSDEQLRNMSTFKELSPESESDVNLKQGLRLFNYWSKRLHPLRDNGQWTDFDCVAHNLGSGRWQPDVPNNNFSGKQPAVKLPEQVGRIEESVKKKRQRRLHKQEDQFGLSLKCCRNATSLQFIIAEKCLAKRSSS